MCLEIIIFNKYYILKTWQVYLFFWNNVILLKFKKKIQSTKGHEAFVNRVRIACSVFRGTSETMTVCFKKRKKTKAVWSVTYYHNFSVSHMAVPLLSPETFVKWRTCHSLPSHMRVVTDFTQIPCYLIKNKFKS